MTVVIFFKQADAYPYDMEQISIKHTTPPHQEWLRSLDFYHFELFISQEHLEEITENNPESNVLEKAEHFKQQISTHKNRIDNLRNRIRENHTNQVQEITDGDENIGRLYYMLQYQYQTEQQLINNLIQEFNHFAAQLA